MESAEQESKLITNQANSVLHDSAKKIYQYTKNCCNSSEQSKESTRSKQS